MSEFRKEIKPSLRGAGFAEVRGAIKNSSPVLGLAESQESLAFEDVKSRRDAARDALKASPESIKKRQEWLFYEALFRDLSYGTKGRGWVRQQAWDGLLEEVYSGARTAINCDIK